MDRDEFQKLLEDVKHGRLEPEEAVRRFAHFPTRDLGCARLDLHRELRSGFGEVVFAHGKDTEDLLRITEALLNDLGRVLITRLRSEQLGPLAERFPALTIHTGCAVAHSELRQDVYGSIGVVTAGTSDRHVAEEAAICARYFGLQTRTINDVGVAGLHRLLQVLPDLEGLDLLIVVAGMEGALPGVVAGACSVPVIAVPTSVGYGAAFQGVTAFLSMLVSCSPGLTVVNIDNGFGAALAAAKVIRHLRRQTKSEAAYEK